ncbi:MAG: hypothetical protein K2V38_07095, partial [Gemmataceae bacterium]|nr:hypothetical protein [Gemmataceae bacterium]
MHSNAPNDRNANRFRPRVEGLEDRTVPAGNVRAVVFDGVLYVAGDDQGNQVRITGAGSRAVVVAPLDSTTTVNGQSGPVYLSGIKRDLFIRMHGGDDVLVVDGTRNRGSLNVGMGDGNDTLTVNAAGQRGATVITTGSGDDTVNLSNFAARRYVSVETGTGTDAVTAQNVRARDFGLLAAPGGQTFFSSQNTVFERPAMTNVTMGAKPPVSPPATDGPPSSPPARPPPTPPAPPPATA